MFSSKLAHYGEAGLWSWSSGASVPPGSAWTLEVTIRASTALPVGQYSFALLLDASNQLRIFGEIGRRLDDNIIVTQRLGLRIAGLIFALICLGHVIRIVAQVDIRIGSFLVPMWPSAAAAVVTAILSIWMFLLSKPPN